MEFDVLSNGRGENGREAGIKPMGAAWCENYFKNLGYKRWTYMPHTIDLALYDENGKAVKPFDRILIRRRAVPCLPFLNF